MKEIAQYALPTQLTDVPEKAQRQKNVIGKDDFMKLLMVQLQHQDPLKPMDHEQFSAQLAQFSSLEQLTNIGKGIDKLHGGMGEEQKLSALGMVGRRVTANGNEVNLTEGNSVAINYTMPDNVKPTRAMIYDSAGQMVRELNLEKEQKDSALVWDGKSQEGVSLPSGRYHFRVAGVDANGVPQDAGSELSGVVTGVELDGKEAILIVRNGNAQNKVAMSKIRQVAIDMPSNPAVNKNAAPKLETATKPNGEIVPVQPTEAEALPAEEVSESWQGYPAAEDSGFRRGGAVMAANPMESFRP